MIKLQKRKKSIKELIADVERQQKKTIKAIENCSKMMERIQKDRAMIDKM